MMKRRIMKLSLIVSALALLCVVPLPRVRATFPGTNGRITFGRFNPAIGDFQIFAADPDGSNEIQLTTVPSEVSDWSPDGSRIAFDFFDGTTVQIATMNPDGTGVVQLTNNSAFNGEPAWSPDGTRLAFDSDAGNHPAGEGIYLMDAATGTVLSRVTANPFGWFDEHPQWSPDGGWIAFTRNREVNSGTAVTALFLVRPDGTGLYQLTPWGMNAAGSDWSPDGTKIAFTSKDDVPARSSIWTIHPDGSGLTALVKATGQADFFDPKWSPDGNKLIVAGRLLSSQRASLWTLDADGSNLSKIATITGRVRFPDWGTHP
jgi:dipeptidyl aminopeptidase/acylaminoacyl peptidase